MSGTIETQFSRGFAWMAAGSLVEQGTNALVFLLLARLLDPASFGLWAMAAAVLLLCEALVRETLSDYLIAVDESSEVLRNTVFWTVLGLGAALALALAAAAWPVARFYHQSQVAHILLALTPVPVLIASAAVPAALLRREMNFRALSLRAMGGMAAGGIVGVALALGGFGVWALVGQRIVQAGVNAIVAWLVEGWLPGLRFERAVIGPMLKFGRGIVGMRAAELCVVQLPAATIGALQGPQLLGYFTIAWRLTELSSFLVTTPLRMASQSAFAAILRASSNGLERSAGALLVDLTRLTSFLGFPIFAALAVLSGQVLMVLAGRGWGPSAPVLSVLAVYGAYLCTAKLYQSFVLASGRPGLIAPIQWAEVAAAVALIALFGRTGPTAAALALLAAIIVFAPLRILAVARIAGFGADALLRPLLLPALGAALAGAAVFAMMPAIGFERPVLRLLSGLSIGLAIYALFSMLFMRARIALLLERFGGRGRPAAATGD